MDVSGESRRWIKFSRRRWRELKRSGGPAGVDGFWGEVQSYEGG